MKITKHNHTFNVSGEYSEMWFNNCINNGTWEQDTFHILDYYKNNEKGIYIDIGSWIGPTVLYSANLYNKVIALEPDPVAIKMLEENMSVNNFTNLILVKKGLSDKNGTSKFGGNGDLGNSESTLLVSKDDYLTHPPIENFLERAEGRVRFDRRKQHHHNDIVEIETITIDTLLKEQNINPEEISLMKMDIEGGEIILVPALKNFLQTYKPPLFISLHPFYLRQSDIKIVINILFDIYDNCYYFTDDGNKIFINREKVTWNTLNGGHVCFVFE